MRLLSAAFALLPAALSAQTLPCAPRERVLAFVIDQRGETRLATGDAARGASVELYASDSGSWTLLLNLPDGRACLLANGENFTATGGLQPARGNPA
ncbi:hypothetical protein [Pararhodobacter aggregans]|uniref:Uncharacterized protein n=1 Tax=Pararhodobacter aggregans TaxID=404875 RepID=A0A2T7ULJ0_9RHOB|nr:hypothetical protein [Pararhodobacter aggregans]PTW99862.1 hypothetical protein C8N33_113114 [Pararhodobacter aggregans]PVE45563.1 hypothetical protein DDE23_21315 [Pararhodobacter aggregans]